METVALYVLGIVIVAVGLAISIALHELGHLVPAKLFGVRVGQYMIGFGRTLWSRRRGETEYGVKAIPLGGYISMAGMFPPVKPGGRARTASTGFFQTMVQDARTVSADTVPEGEEHRTFYNLPVWKRVIIMAGGPFMNLVIAVALFAILLGGFGVRQVSTTIGSVSACLRPATSAATTCGPNDPEAPGAAGGILPGDRLVSIDGTQVADWAQATSIIQSSPARALAIIVERDGNPVELMATPALTERFVLNADGAIAKNADGTNRTQRVGMLGVTAAYEMVPQPMTAVLPAVGENIAGVTNVILNLPQRLVDVAAAAFGPGERDPTAR